MYTWGPLIAGAKAGAGGELRGGGLGPEKYVSPSTSRTPISCPVCPGPFEVQPASAPLRVGARLPFGDEPETPHHVPLRRGLPLAPLGCVCRVLDPLLSLSRSGTSSKPVAFGDPKIHCLQVQKGH